MSRQRQVVTVTDDEADTPSSAAVSDRTRSRRGSREPGANYRSPKRAVSGRRRPTRTVVAPTAQAVAPSQAPELATQHTAQAPVVDLTRASPPADEDDDIVLVSVRHAPQSASSRLLGRCISAAFGSAHLLPAQARKSKPSPTPNEDSAPSRPGPQCGVCMDALKDPACGSCGHVYCEGCLRDAVKIHKKCPACRKTMTLKQIKRIYL